MIKKLIVQERALERAVARLAVAGAGAWGRTKGSLEARIAALEAAVHSVESKLRPS